MQDRNASSSLTQRLDRLARVAGLTLSWERLWPPLLALGVIVALFLTVSWLGLWLHLPRWGRISGLIVFAALLAWPAWLFWRVRLPSRAEALDRIDRDSGLPHRPAATLDDQLANATADPATRALWRIHLQRAAQTASQFKIASPSPGVSRFDRYAVRGGVLLALIASAFIAGPEKYPRVLAAFDFNAAGSISQGYRLDAWIDPPAYTGRAPQVLRLQDETGARPGNVAQKIQAPAGSTIIMRASDGAGVSAEIKGGIVDKADEEKAEDKNNDKTKPATNRAVADAKRSDQEKRWSLRADGTLTLRRLGSTIATFDISAIADRPPVITLKGEPKSNARGSLTLSYKIEDDYGVVGAEAEFSKPSLRGKPVTGRMLYDAPKMPLALAQGPGGLGDGETTGDLSEHPWAGAQVTMSLMARDEAGNTGHSDPVELTLPQRTFVKPLARALVEQRRNLVFAPDNRARVMAAMEGLMIEPEKFQTGTSVYLGLYAIAKRLQAARTDDQLRDTADLMWEMALRLEEGDLTGAERDLRAAQQALRDAMNRGASDEELRKLMDQLRAALDKFMQELAERQMRDGDQQADNQQPDPNTRFITPQDLRSMLDRMEDMARNGNMADAQRMLDQLQNMLENLQTARRQSQQNSAQREMNRALNQLDQMMRDQQELRDDTYGESQGRPRQRAQRNQQQRQNGQQQRGQRQQGQQQPGQQGEGDEQDNADNPNGQGLQQRQEALRKQLQDLQRRMREMGLPPEQGFSDAEDAMNEAEQQLGEGSGEGQGKAVGSQGRALESLRKGAQSMAQQMQQQGGQPGEQSGGPGDPNGPGQRGRDAARSDPLGRESRDRGDNSRSRYDPLGVPAAQRAQQVLEELRRRLGDQTRPREELDYLERLLRRY
ncbi:MAG: TIGR02302 family protein [Rhizobiales bacterium 62-17]|nr:MAG: TIGR02302 family protein [Rhizobiales bacterium 62-17]